MKRYIDLQTEEEAMQWLSEMKALLKIPSQRPDVTAVYRDHLDWWDKLETWQKEELTESYEAELTQLASDSTAYGNFPVTPEELKNLSGEALNDFSFFAQTHVPSAVIHERCEQLEKGLGEKGGAKFQQMAKDALERYETLKKIENIGQ